MAFNFEEKLRALQERGVDTPEGILAVLTGDIGALDIGKRGLDTPAEREYLEGVMGGRNPSSFRSSSAGHAARGKDDYQMDVSKALYDAGFADPTKLGIGERGLNSAAERQYLEKTVNRNNQQFDAELSKLSPPDLANVLEILQGLSSQEKEIYMNHVIKNNGFDYGTIHEGGTRGLDTPAERQFLKQQQDNWMNNDRVKNLGFSNQQAQYSPDKRIYPNEIIEELKRQGIILDSEVLPLGNGSSQVIPRGVVA